MKEMKPVHIILYTVWENENEFHRNKLSFSKVENAQKP